MGFHGEPTAFTRNEAVYCIGAGLGSRPHLDWSARSSEKGSGRTPGLMTGAGRPDEYQWVTEGCRLSGFLASKVVPRPFPSRLVLPSSVANLVAKGPGMFPGRLGGARVAGHIALVHRGSSAAPPGSRSMAVKVLGYARLDARVRPCPRRSRWHGQACLAPPGTDAIGLPSRRPLCVISEPLIL
jgi:hypothetical protein